MTDIFNFLVLLIFMRVILSNALIYYLMDECQLYSTLIELKSPWKVGNVPFNSVKKTVELYITHGKVSKLFYLVCRKECMVYGHLKERVWMVLIALSSRHIFMNLHQSILQ